MNTPNAAGKRDLTIHLDTYIQETLAEYKASVTKFLRPKQVPMQPGIMLEQEDCPESPDQVRQKMCRSFVAKLQFAASWLRCDIAFTTSHLARFCASAGPSHRAALHHVVVYLEAGRNLASSCHTNGVSLTVWMVSQTLIGRTASRGGQLLGSLRASIAESSSGNPRCRRQSRCRETNLSLDMAIEILYPRNLLENMGFMQAPDAPVYEDTEACSTMYQVGKHDWQTRAG